MGYVVSAALVLFLFWFTLSGIYTPFLLISGALAAIGVALFCRRLKIVDKEGQPIYLLFSALRYWPWLVWQIVLSALSVSRIIVSPNLPISPTLLRVKASQKTDIGIVTYANSITLTPGTISVEVEEGEILVHAITKDSADGLEEGTMDRRVARFEGTF